MYNSRESRLQRQIRVRQKLKKDIKKTGRLRLSVFRSSKHIYAQIIDDKNGKTLVSASSKEKGFDALIKKAKEQDAKGKILVSKIVGSSLAEKAKKDGIKKVVFDRGGYIYHGRIKALADAARDNGLEF